MRQLLVKELHCREVKVKRRYLKPFKSGRITQETRTKGTKEMAHKNPKKEKRIGPDSIQLKRVSSMELPGRPWLQLDVSGMARPCITEQRCGTARP